MPTWETEPEDGGSAGGGEQSGGQPGDSGAQSGGGSPGSESGSETAGGGGGAGGSGDDESWESGLPGGGGGWETSNQIPGANSSIPPMPSERDKPAGSGADSELDAALKDFDGEILAEREIIQARANESAANNPAPGSLPSSGAGGSGGVSGGLPGGGGNAEGDTQQGFPGASGPRSRSAPPAPSTQSSVPEDIPDARDDDIIARQLREAAMNETDPELQEKLWDEYRRYKDG